MCVVWCFLEDDAVHQLKKLEFLDVLALVTNRDYLSRDLATRNSWDELVEVLEQVLPSEMRVSRDLLIDLACMDECNSIGFWDGSRDMYAFALAPTGSYFNHSCDPNVKKFTEGRNIVFRALKDVLPGEELAICYAWVDDGVLARRKTLVEGFCFDCTCERCLRELLELESEPKKKEEGNAAGNQKEPLETPQRRGADNDLVEDPGFSSFDLSLTE